MLRSINIRNLAVIERLRVEFHKGLNLLTGETGGGKSIIVDALGLLLGQRSAAAQVRTGEERAIVEGLFEIEGEDWEGLSRALTESGIETEDVGELMIRREINVNGRSRVFINDQDVTLNTLRKLRQYLVEIHGQGEQMLLLSASAQMDLLDSFGECLQVRKEVQLAYAGWKNAVKELLVLLEEDSERARVETTLQHQLAAIEAVQPVLDEDEVLTARLNLLTQAEKVLRLGQGAYSELYEKDQSLIWHLSQIIKQVQELAQIDTRLAPSLEELNAVKIVLTDVAEMLRQHSVVGDFSQAELNRVDARLLELERLKRRFGTDLSGILAIQTEIAGKLGQFEDFQERKRLMEKALEKAHKEYTEKALRLSACRLGSVERFMQEVIGELKQLSMGQARFVSELYSAPNKTSIEELFSESDSVAHKLAELEQNRDGFYSATGADKVVFLLSTNEGEPPKNLAQVASGGELSRLMLALRAVGLRNSVSNSSGETIVFDEIDVGIGGRVSEAVGRRLKLLAKEHQVLCVTHQPQIARFADTHYFVSKTVRDGRTMTFVRSLNREERIVELARMIGGDGEVETTQETARWLLDQID